MNLAEILRNKAAGKAPSPPKEEIKEDQISYTSVEPPDPDLFFATWAPFIRNPLGYNFLVRRDYADFLLEGKAYTINLFTPISGNYFFHLYNSYLELNDYLKIQKLCYFCGHMELSIPIQFHDRIEAIIREEFEK